MFFQSLRFVKAAEPSAKFFQSLRFVKAAEPSAKFKVQSSKFNVQSYMYLEIKENEGVLTGILSGHIDTLASEELGREMAPLLESADRQIVLDCENLAYISSSGLRLLLTLRKKVAADGGSLVIRNINDEIRKVFTLTGFFKLFDIRN